MFEADAKYYRHPRTGQSLDLHIDQREGDRIVSGALVGGGETFPIVQGIPRFCPGENYAESFGYQWQLYSTTQLDSQSPWGKKSEERLYTETRWPKNLEGQRILEAGSGMGRFTEVLGRTGAQVCTFDYSAAVNANYRNNSKYANVSFAQGDIYNPPYEHGSFDKVLCIGVIQHCPSPREAFRSLVRFVKPGGQIVIDHYRLYWKSLFFGKYYLRPFTRKMRPETLHKFVKLHVGWAYPLTGMIHKLAGRPIRGFSWLLGVADYRGVYDVDEKTLWEMSMLDTFDMLAPAYDRPRTVGTIRRWFEEEGLVDIDVHPGWNGVEGRGRKPE